MNTLEGKFVAMNLPMARDEEIRGWDEGFFQLRKDNLTFGIGVVLVFVLSVFFKN